MREYKPLTEGKTKSNIKLPPREKKALPPPPVKPKNKKSWI